MCITPSSTHNLQGNLPVYIVGLGDFDIVLSTHELFVKFIFLSLLSVDLTMFLLYSLGYNQYTSGFDWTHKTRKYEYIAPLPQWISDWLWDHRQNDHIRMASRLMDWEDSCTYADWSEICRRLKFDGDDPPEVYKKCRFEKGDLWSSIHL